MHSKNLIKIKGIWYYRAFIPSELHERIGTKEIRKTLKTDHLQKAIMLRNRLHESYKMAIRQVEAMPKDLSTKDLRNIVSTYLKNAFEDHKHTIFQHSYDSIEQKNEGISELKDMLSILDTVKQLGVTPERSKELYLEMHAERLGINLNELSEASRESLEGILVRCMYEANKHFTALLEGTPVSDKIEDNYLKNLFEEGDPLLQNGDVIIERQATNKPSYNEDNVVISELAKSFYTSKKNTISPIADRTLNSYMANIETFIFIMGDISLDLITKRKCSELKQLAANLPKNRKARFKDKTHKQLQAMTYEKVAPTTVNNLIRELNVVFGWAVKNGYMSENPMSGLVDKPSKKKKNEHRSKNHPYSPEDIKRLFESPLYTGCQSQRFRYKAGDLIIKDELYWLPLVSIHSGLRLEEVCQLEAGDIYQKDNIWVFDINENGSEKSLKTINSERIVPIHPYLIELGLIEHLKVDKKKTTDKVWNIVKGSHGKYGDKPSKQFGKYKKNLGFSGIHTFHSFRSTFIDAMKQAGVRREIVKDIVGHEGGDLTFDGYANEFDIKILFEEIKKVNYGIKI